MKKHFVYVSRQPNIISPCEGTNTRFKCLLHPPRIWFHISNWLFTVMGKKFDQSEQLLRQVGWLVGLKKRPKKICSCDKKVWDLNVNSKNFEKISILVFVQTVFCFPCLLFCFLLHLSSSFIVCRMIPYFYLPLFFSNSDVTEIPQRSQYTHTERDSML